MGRKGGAQNPNEVRVSLDGKALAESQYELIPGGIKLKVDAGRPGDHKISGDLVFKNNGNCKNRFISTTPFTLIND